MNAIESIIYEVIEREGGFVNHPDDRGGPTNFGITLKLYSKYKQNPTVDDLKKLTKQQAHDIYYLEFFVKTNIVKIFSISQLIAEELLDTAVNMGPKNAITFLQSALNAFNKRQELYKDIPVNGIIDAATLEALEEFKIDRGQKGELVLLKALNCLQGARYIELSQTRRANESFVYGWINKRIHI